MATPGLNVPTSLIVAPSSRTKVTREIGSAAISEKRTCNADRPTVEGASSFEMVTAVDTSQRASSIGGKVATPIRELRISDVNTLLVPLQEFNCDIVTFGASDRRLLQHCVRSPRCDSRAR